MIDYSFSNLIGTIYSLILTKIAYPRARLVRRPVYVRGKKGIQYGEGLTTGHSCRIDASNKKTTLRIGKDARFGDYVHINADESVTIGDNLLTASKVFISDANHGAYKGERQSAPDINPSLREILTSPVTIGDNVWIGENAIILAGSHIGNGCIIGANTLISGDYYPDGVMIVGTPGRIIKKYNYSTKQWEKVSGDNNETSSVLNS